MLWQYWQEEWLLGEKVEFDGINKLILIHPEVTSLDIRSDVYSAWVRWLPLQLNTQFLPAMRFSGLDQIPGGVTGDTYFLINGWKFLVDLRKVAITGVLFSDDYDTAYYDYDTSLPLYPTKVSALVNTVNISGGGVDWSNTEKEQIRHRLGIDGTIATPLQTPSLALLSKQIEIQSAMENISVSSSAVNSPAIGFVITHGTNVSGSFTDTRSINSSEHIISDSAAQFDVKYLFDIGLNSVPSTITFVGFVFDQHETVNVQSYNYKTLSWDDIGIVSGSKTTLSSYSWTLYQDNVGFIPNQIGDVQIRFISTVESDVVLHCDQIYVSYSVQESKSGFSAHAVAATSTTIQLPIEASNIDGYYVPCLLTVNHGTGADQYAKVIGYIGATRTLQLELPMMVTLDTTSHISLSPWASSKLEVGQKNEIASQVRTELTDEMDKIDSGALLLAQILSAVDPQTIRNALTLVATRQTDAGSADDKLDKTLKTSQFIALQ